MTSIDTAVAGVHRLSGLPVEQIRVELVESDKGTDSFAVTVDAGVLAISATTPATALAGYAQFARRTGIGSVSRSGVRLASALPADGSLASETRFPWRVAYNITVAGYTTPFFDWSAWERELDLLAASGINAAHLTLGQEVVWLQAFQNFGYREDELLAWIVPPSHQAWQWLNNIQYFGRGTTVGLIDRRVDLARRVLDRMAELQIRPILPGFSGTVPAGFADRNLNATVVPQGRWFMDVAGPVRPDWLSSASSLYADVAARFYRAQYDAFGVTGTWAVDLLHEGGTLGDVPLADAARGVETAMRAAADSYTWVIQAWGGNPRQDLLDALDPARLLVLDLTGEDWTRPGVYGDAPWVCGILPNYGGRLSLYGDLEAIARTPASLAAAPSNRLAGLTDTAEGVANNPVVWDLFHDLTWTTRPIDLDDWLPKWVIARYGAHDEDAIAAWQVLRQTAYGPWRTAESAPPPPESTLALAGEEVDAGSRDRAPSSALLPMTTIGAEDADEQLGAFSFYAGTDSVIAAIPSLDANQASLVGPRTLPYPPGALLPAMQFLRSAAGRLPSSPSLTYDLVDISRQATADAARTMLGTVRAAHANHDIGAFDDAVGAFLDLIGHQDTILAAHPDFRLDTWLDAARAWGVSSDERDELVEWAARLLTSWGTRDDFVLTEYANRDWNGVVGTYYGQRWSLWFTELRKVLLGEPTTPVDWYAVAEQWIHSVTHERDSDEGAAPPLLHSVDRALVLLQKIHG
ncbi:alpha-N-acetylglucosaminidase TIM-barrel domain-containing protein [uncultured Amnibacterium sp.]|uniref:alpha-N-acetylglucosaminidase n=1 Tax=uncultured Amnibacterium sp. TaxID=1631851 RepID=UPI0035C9BE4A